MVTRVVLFVIGLIGLTIAGVAAGAQEPPPALPPAAPPAFPITVQEAPPPMPPRQPVEASQPPPLSEHTIRERRKHIFMMEGMFVGAVRGAAQDIAERMPNDIGALPMLTGSLTARGFMLEGYGVFFAVEIPGVVPSVASLQVMRQRSESAREGQAQPLRTADSAAAAAADPNVHYVDLVRNALIDAMVDYSKPLELQPYEWLTVAAADGDEPLNPAYLAQRSTLVLRVRGSDIADYLSGRLTKDAVRRKVEVRKF